MPARRRKMSDPKRANHNMLERRRRDNIKDSFDCLRSRIPDMSSEKTSRAIVLQKATQYINQLEGNVMSQSMEETELRQEIEDLRRLLEEAKSARN